MLSKMLPVPIFLTDGVNSMIYNVLAGVGCLLCVYSIFRAGKRFFCLENLLLSAFLAVCVLSSLLNIKYGIANNAKTIVWTAIQFFLLYGISWKLTGEEIKTEFYRLTNVLSVIWFCGIAVSLYQFLFQIEYVIPYQEYSRRQGFMDERLFGIFTDPNFAAVTSVCVIVFSLLAFRRSHSRPVRVFHVVNCVFQFLYIVLSGSRTAELAGLVAAFLYMFGYLHRKMQKKELPQAKKILLPLAGALLCCVIVAAGVEATKYVSSYVPRLVSGNVTHQPVDLHREDVEESSDISNLRIEIWTDVITIWSSKPIFGVSPRNLTVYAQDKFPNLFLSKRGYAAHNGYLAVLAGVGLAGSLVMLAFIVISLRKIFLYMKKKFAAGIPTFDMICLILLTVIAVSALTLQDIFFVNSLNTALFWLILGYLIQTVKRESAGKAAPLSSCAGELKK
jgi:O-antigen ligase